MPHPAPRALAENAGLVFVGERVALTAFIPPKLAEQMLGTRNPHGKSNADVLRRLATAADPRRPAIHWLIDFPPEMGEREASLYEHPFHYLYRTARPTRDRWGVNPHADARLRAALAKRERYLATPIGAELPAFLWFESDIIPDDTLVALARDDDFTHGVVQSRGFVLWWRRFHSRSTPTLALSSFPFPWPLATTLSALTATQEEQRHAIARAARGGDSDQLNATVAAAYGWPVGLDDDELLTHLQTLHRQRAD
ncbi:MAG TPA: hypothetical protein VKC51_06120 [Lacunisphaera sp.]|nr:hypothetical protein [Lacunisphaera sp.]